MSFKHPRVGLGVMIFNKKGQVLLGKRKSSHGDGEYAWPGGHLEHLESFEDCARREVKEETGLEIKNIQFLRVLNMTEYAPKHYVDIGLSAELESGEPELKEPDKCESWEWYDLEKLPSPLFHTIPTMIESYKSGKKYFDVPN